MADRPILFSGPMVRALLAGRKTQTRRVLDRRWSVMGSSWRGKSFDRLWAALDFDRAVSAGHKLRVPWMHPDDGDIRSLPIGDDDMCWYSLYPQIEAGDRLWVRETWGTGTRPCPHQGWRDGIEYRADVIEGDETIPLHDVEPPSGIEWPEHTGRWRPSIFCPRWASRITLLVDEVKVERLQEIREEDAIAEGATMRPKCCGFRDLGDGWSMDWSRVGEPSPLGSGDDGRLHERDVSLGCAKTAFGSFINELHGGRHWNFPGKPTPIWDVNPWVAAIRFRVVPSNIDALPAEAA